MVKSCMRCTDRSHILAPCARYRQREYLNKEREKIIKYHGGRLAARAAEEQQLFHVRTGSTGPDRSSQQTCHVAVQLTTRPPTPTPSLFPSLSQSLILSPKNEHFYSNRSPWNGCLPGLDRKGRSGRGRGRGRGRGGGATGQPVSPRCPE